ncbi:MAG TPA: hypothetical protein VGN14_01765 [Candidatus Elarobacter sp.]|jgi:hypothetical protein
MAAVMAVGISACGGGGGGGGSSVPGGGGGQQQPSVSGDMLALSPSRGWNYQTSNLQGVGPATISLYTDPTPVTANETALVATGVPGLVPTVLTSTANAESNLLGALGLTSGTAGYNVVAEASAGSNAAVPGSPLFVGSTLTQGAVSTPYPGVTETVLSVGTVAGAAACPTPNATGAQVQYTYQTYTATISYVPGCGITAATLPQGSFVLTSIGSYPSLGNLSAARRVASASWITTARSLLGLEHNAWPAAKALFP